MSPSNSTSMNFIFCHRYMYMFIYIMYGCKFVSKFIYYIVIHTYTYNYVNKRIGYSWTDTLETSKSGCFWRTVRTKGEELRDGDSLMKEKLAFHSIPFCILWFLS